MMEFLKFTENWAISGWIAWDFGVGMYIRVHKKGTQIHAGLLFFDFYIDVYRTKKKHKDKKEKVR